ncbi:MAG: nucleotide exchange factor GrpE [Gammaproteobacteria bacterium]|nr:nucleotide exchange factor GrpE [Gammaproteobacteria bacterium]MCI0591365.1 nucleotide exchange factor GrpE [Gammaproteobacteria bacterium]
MTKYRRHPQRKGDEGEALKQANNGAQMSGDAEPNAAETVAEQQPKVPATDQSVEELSQALEEARQKADEHWNALLRAKAELENLRKRTARDVANAHKYALESFITELLPVKDSVELGLSASGNAADVVNLREGMELTLKMFDTAFQKFGVTVLDPQGEVFNPDLHEAISMQETKEAEPGTVMTVVQKGYLLKDRLLRPAMVIVAKRRETEA